MNRETLLMLVGMIVLGLPAAINTIGGAVEKIAKAKRAVEAPNAAQNEEIRQLKSDVDDIKKKLVEDKRRLDESQRASHISQEALLALLEHGLNGNNVEQMTNAKNKLNDYLINH